MAGKPFDHIAARAGAPVMTACGWSVELHKHYDNGMSAGTITRGDGTESPEIWDSKGLPRSIMSVDRHLVMAPRKRTLWFALWPVERGRSRDFGAEYMTSPMFASEEALRHYLVVSHSRDVVATATVHPHEIEG